MITLVCATTNPGKVAEIADGLRGLGGVLTLAPRPAEVPDVVEDADTLVGNARLKAGAVRDATGEAAIADDTGLEVAALGGAPGVRTARFAGDGATDAANRAALLAALDGATDRRACFRTVVLVAWPDGTETVAEGVCRGTISDGERGDRGFGYDAVFVPDAGDGRTFAEMSLDDKQAVSHRAEALRSLLTELSSRLA